jgi:hypothetical protein
MAPSGTSPAEVAAAKPPLGVEHLDVRREALSVRRHGRLVHIS